MRREVEVKIVGVQKASDLPAERIETRAEGIFAEKNGKKYVLFEECPDPEQPSQKVKNRITWDGGSVSLRKEGAISSDMHFAPGHNHELEYKTPFGQFHMKISDVLLSVEDGEEFSDLRISYRLTIQDAHTTKNEMRIQIRQK